jgi:UDP-N-acetylmuramoyl-L-alanyl-D-glutamate--2,6-diaminopimelate ligase
MILKDLIQNVEVTEVIGSDSIDVIGIAYDSRKIGSDWMFVAMKGSMADGHDFIGKAIENGAKSILCEQVPEGFYENITWIVTNDSRKALAKISHNFYDNPTRKMRIIGITGTNGKTTTTYLMKSIFEEAGDKCGLIGTTGIIIGDEFIPATHTTPESLELCAYFDLMLKKGVKTVLMEVSSHALDQHRVDNVDFNTVLFTNLTPDHLDYHKDMLDYATAKKKLFDMLAPEANGLLFNLSDFTDYFVQDTKASTYLMGRFDNPDFLIGDEKIGLGNSEFRMSIPIKLKLAPIKIKTKLSGRFNIDNAALAAGAALIDGIDPKIVIKALADAAGAPGRMQTVSLSNGALALVDYAHTPDALEKALIACREVLEHAGSDGRLIVVFGCGGDRDRTKRPVMGSIASNQADLAIITSDNPRTEDPNDIIQEVYAGIDDKNRGNVMIIPDRAEAIDYAVEISKKNDLILVAGKGHENYQIIGKEKHHFDDTEQLMRFSKD